MDINSSLFSSFMGKFSLSKIISKDRFDFGNEANSFDVLKCMHHIIKSLLQSDKRRLQHGNQGEFSYFQRHFFSSLSAPLDGNLLV